MGGGRLYLDESEVGIKRQASYGGEGGVYVGGRAVVISRFTGGRKEEGGDVSESRMGRGETLAGKQGLLVGRASSQTWDGRWPFFFLVLLTRNK